MMEYPGVYSGIVRIEQSLHVIVDSFSDRYHSVVLSVCAVLGKLATCTFLFIWVKGVQYPIKLSPGLPFTFPNPLSFIEGNYQETGISCLREAE